VSVRYIKSFFSELRAIMPSTIYQNWMFFARPNIYIKMAASRIAPAGIKIRVCNSSKNLGATSKF
jgi:hypothetical protein